MVVPAARCYIIPLAVFAVICWLITGSACAWKSPAEKKAILLFLFWRLAPTQAVSLLLVLYSLPKKVLVINMQLHNRYILRNNKFGVAKNQEFGVFQLPGSLGKSCHWPVLSEVVERPGGGYGVCTYHSVTQGGAVR